jgi:hypothetical protein
MAEVLDVDGEKAIAQQMEDKTQEGGHVEAVEAQRAGSKV